jgi:hypothetical protein
MKYRSLIFILLLLVIGCSKYDRDFEIDERSFGNDTIQFIEQHSQIDLPTGARGLNFFYKAPIDPGFAAKIEIPSVSRDDMLGRLLKIKKEEVHVSGALGPRFKWWIPSQSKKLIDREGINNDCYIHGILTEEEGRIIFYIEWSTF